MPAPYLLAFVLGLALATQAPSTQTPDAPPSAQPAGEHAAEPVQQLVAQASESRRQRRNLVHDLGRMLVAHRITQRIRESHRGFPILEAAERLHDLAHARDAALGIGERSVLLQERRAREEHVRELR